MNWSLSKPDSNCLLLESESIEHLLGVHRALQFLSYSSMGFESANFVGAPHLVSIELIRASELVSILGAVDAGEECVFGLPAQLFVPLHCAGVAHGVQTVLQERHIFY